jgi:hypothetical protein
MSSATATIPFEPQSASEASRDCGAACLSMVYRSLGKKVPQEQIWPAIAKPNRFGSVASTTHLMTRDALNRGLAAVAFQACHPLQCLRLCCESGTRAILNHRLTPDSPSGHYSVLVDVDVRDVVLHDPSFGPARRVPHDQFLELWQPNFPNAEIAGYVLIAVAAEPPAPTACWLCRTPMPATVACPRCKEPVPLQPSGALGCIDNSCVARTWNYLCCSSCDFGFTLNSQDSPGQELSGTASGAPTPTAAPADPMDLSRMFEALDKFCSFALTVPGAAQHPDVQKQLEVIASTKEKLKLAQVEARVHSKAYQEQLANVAQAAQKNAAAHRQKMEELNRPSPPLDPHALGRALLKSLGWDS